MKHIFNAFLSVLLFILIFSVSSCDSKNENLVITSFYANNEITKELTKGTDIEIECLITGAIEPHDYELTAKQRASIEDAKLVIVNGLGLEEYLTTLENNSNIKDKICYSNSEINQIDSDPHSFVSPLEAITITKTISKSLQAHFSESKDIISKNEETYVASLTEISNAYKDYFASTNNLYVLGHSAYAYLNRDYGMNVNSVLGIHEEEASASRISDICNFIQNNNIRTIFGEYFEENDTINTISRSTNTTVSYLYTLEMMDDTNLSLTDAFRKNLENLSINY